MCLGHLQQPGSQFITESWQELCRLSRTKFAYGTAYPQTQEVVERMKSVIEELRFLIHQTRGLNDWEIISQF